MRIHLCFCAALLTLVILLGSGSPAQAGSFFGPCCYGSRFTESYPARSHNAFGSLNGSRCSCWHPLWKRWYNKYRVQIGAGNGDFGATSVTTAAPPLAQPAQITPPGH